MLEKLGELVRDKKLPEISNIHDAADRHGIDIIIDLKANAIPQVVLNKLYKQTQLQVGYGVIMLALVDGVPRVLSLKETLQYYIKHQKEVIVRRTRFDLARAEERAHILEGYVIALDNIDEVIQIIRASETDKEAAEELTSRFGLTKRQTDAILEMKLRRLTGLEREKIENELQELRQKIDYYKQVLADDSLVCDIIREEMGDIKKRFSTGRRTKISGASRDMAIEDLIADDNMVVTMTQSGYIKRMSVDLYKQQKRGGKGLQGTNLKENDVVENIFTATNHSYMLFFTSTGKVYRIKVYDIPECSRQARGTAIVNLLHLEKGETVKDVIATKDFPEDEYLMFGTREGIVKKTSMDLYDRTRKDGLKAINLREGDELVNVKRVKPGENVVMVSSIGKAIVFSEEEIRPMGRGTSGVRGMNVSGDAHVLGMEIASEGAELLVMTENGYGKRTSLDAYPVHHRGGQGIATITMTDKKGQIALMKVVREDDDIMLITADGVIERTAVAGISKLGRTAQGVTIMSVDKKDKLIAVAIATDKRTRNANGDLVEEGEDAEGGEGAFEEEIFADADDSSAEYDDEMNDEFDDDVVEEEEVDSEVDDEEDI